MKLGASSVYASIILSAKASSSAAWGSAAHSCGTHCVNNDIECRPAGQSVGSSVEGMHPSENGRVEALPAFASWKPCCMYSFDSAIITEPVW